MNYLSAAAVLLLLLSFGGCAHSGKGSGLKEPGSRAGVDATARYDWRLQKLDLNERVQEGDVARIVVENLSPLCYSYSLESEPRERVDRPEEIEAYLAQFRTQAGPPTVQPPEAIGRGVTPDSVRNLAASLADQLVAMCAPPRESIGSRGRWNATVTPAFDSLISAYGELAPTERAGVHDIVENARQAYTAAERALADEELVDNVTIGREIEAIEVEVVATGHAKELTEGDTIRDDFDVPVEVDGRFIASTGLFFSGIDSHDFERANVPAGDSVISTYVDQEGGDYTAFAPTVLVSYLLPIPGVDWLALAPSAGLTYRQVNDEDGVEYLGGGSLVFGDQFLISIMGHYGRTEELLIEADGAVPTEVTKESAVGIRKRLAWALAVTWHP